MPHFFLITGTLFRSCFGVSNSKETSLVEYVVTFLKVSPVELMYLVCVNLLFVVIVCFQWKQRMPFYVTLTRKLEEPRIYDGGIGKQNAIVRVPFVIHDTLD